MEESDKSADPEAMTGDEPGDAPQAAWAVASTVALDLGKRFGQLIGRYKVVRVLGEGGMGAVFLAEQDKPTRLVALKVIRAGVASANLLRRFEHEAQVLGRLQHPGIAQIYEAGTADTGEGAQPYFVMEYVRGRSLLEYAQALQLGTRQRLELLAKICDAVQHAHQKGIIHRDLKPGNILVTEEGQPKILDFGVARATDADIQATTIQTDVGQLVGTIPYMSPEQAGGDVTELDTRSDVYALGVLGYELLAGRLPYDLSKKMIHEAVRVIREDDPTPLSSINRVFRGDVETIIAKALQKERVRRYQSASDLASDIRRYLTDQPIVARPPSVGYQLSKFTKRNKALVAGVAAVFIVLVGGIVTTSVALARESEQRSLAQSLRQVADNRRIEAEDARDAEAEARAEAQQRQEEAEVARAEAQRMADEARFHAYVANVTAAAVAIEHHELPSARRRLAASPEELRNWVWRYLQNQADQSWKTLPVEKEMGFVFSVAFSPDGTRIASGSEDKTVKLWDAASGAKVAILRGHSGLIRSVAFSPDGLRIASGSSDNTIRIWDAITHKELVALRGHDHLVSSVAFSSDGARVASGSYDNTLKLWDAATGAELATLRGHRHAVNSIAFSSDGGRIASGSSDETVKVWDITTGAELLILRGHKGSVLSVAFSSDGARIASGSADNTIKLWEAVGGAELATLRGHEYRVTAVALSPDGALIVSGSSDTTLKLWNASTGAELATLRGHDSGVTSVTFGPDGTFIASGAIDGTAKIWPAASAAALTALRGHQGAVFSIAFSPNGARIASTSDDKTIRLWDTSTGSKLATLRGHRDAVTCVAFSPDGTRLASGSTDKSIKLWDAATGEELATMRGEKSLVTSVAFSPDGTRLASGSPLTIKLWDTATGEELATPRRYGLVNCVAFSPDGTRIILGTGSIFSGTGDNIVSLWDAVAGGAPATLGTHEGWVTFVAFSPDGTRIASASGDKTIKLWDGATGAELATLRGHRSVVSCVAFSPDGTRLASGSWDGTVKIWDVVTGLELTTLRGHEDIVLSVAFSPDGKRIASGSDDGTVTLWDSVPMSVRHKDRQSALAARANVQPIVERIFAEFGDAPKVAHRLRTDETLSELARQQALNLALSLAVERREPILTQARSVVAELFDRLIFSKEVIAAIVSDDALSDDVRAAALELARTQRAKPTQVAIELGKVILSPNERPEVYKDALGKTEALLRLVPDDDPLRLAAVALLGAAQYRVGDYQTALATFIQANQTKSLLFPGGFGPAHIGIAMCEYQLGHVKEARDALEKTRTLMKHPLLVDAEEIQSLLREAEALIGGE